jgi:catecholate siderophore receptor
VSKTPRLDNFTHIEATYGTEDYLRGMLDTNQTLESSPLKGTSVRLNAVWTDGGVAGRDVVENKNWGVAPSIAFGVGTPTTVSLAYLHLEQDNIPDYGLPMTLPAGAAAAGQTINDLDWSNFYGLIDRDYEHVNADAATATIDHKFSQGATLRNLTRWGRNVRDAVVTPPRAASVPPTVPSATNGMLDPGYDPTKPQIRRTDTKYQDRADETITNLTNLTVSFDTGKVKHDVAAGLEFAREDQKSYTRVDDNVATTAPNANRPPIADLYHPNPGDPYKPAIHRNGASTAAIADSGAVYAFDTLQFNSHWQVSLGGRWELVDASYKVVTAPAGTTPATTTRFQHTDDMLSWRAGIVYKPVEAGSIYAAYGTSFNPSIDAAQGLALTAANAALDPEENRSLEAGVKWDLIKRKLGVTVAVFQTEKINARTTDSAGNTVLAGNQKVSGLELGATGNLTDDWSIFGGYAYMDSVVDASGISQQVDAQLPYVPKHTLNLWTTYRFPFRLSIGGGAQFTDGYFFALPTATAAPTVSPQTRYWLFSAMASYEVNRHLTLRLNVNNLADEKYMERGYSAHFTPGTGRTILATASLSF